jgi:ankyrin repeat protein
MRFERAAATCVALLTLATGAQAQSPLADAAMRGNRAAAQALIERRADVNATQVDGTTALHWAVRNNDLDLTRQLLKAGASANATNRYGLTPLTLAAETGSAALVDALLASGGMANAASREGETVLMLAARAGNVPAVRSLLAKGADPNAAESWFGQTALMWAAGENHAGVVTALIEAGASIDARSRAGEGQPKRSTPDGVAFQTPHTNFPRGSFTPLMFAARDGALDGARALLDAGAAINLTQPDGMAALHLAIINAHYDVAALLVERGADVNLQDTSGRSPLFLTADLSRLEWLFSRPAPKASGRMEAIDLARLLLDKGADPNARITRKPALLHHEATGNASIATGATALFKAATTSDVPLFMLLLERGADPFLATQNKTTPFLAVAGLNWKDIASIGTEDESLKLLQVLLDRGADVNAANDLGETAMHAAAQRGADRIIRFLHARGARLNEPNKEGRTPLDEAIGQANESIEDNVRRPERKSTQVVLRELIDAGKMAASNGQ